VVDMEGIEEVDLSGDGPAENFEDTEESGEEE